MGTQKQRSSAPGDGIGTDSKKLTGNPDAANAAAKAADALSSLATPLTQVEEWLKVLLCPICGELGCSLTVQLRTGITTPQQVRTEYGNYFPR